MNPQNEENRYDHPHAIDRITEITENDSNNQIATEFEEIVTVDGIKSIVVDPK